MSVFESNNFTGQTIEIGADTYIGNRFERCRLIFWRLPVGWDGNLVVDCEIVLQGVMADVAQFLVAMNFPFGSGPKPTAH